MSDDDRPIDEIYEDLEQHEIIDDYDSSDEYSEEEHSFSDSVCAFCENGGIMLCCEGPCMRSFHATEADGAESFCESLGFTEEEVDEHGRFYCKNCEFRQHQCFACGKLGSSDKDSGAAVMKCAYETCGRFYHPHCVTKLLPRSVKRGIEDFEKHVAQGNPFTCPLHFCFVCKGLENEMHHDFQFAVCNRCPRSYHRGCLPVGINFYGIRTRAWEGLLLNNRVLIYCLNHEISDELGTPVRDHIKFPDIGGEVINMLEEEQSFESD